MMKEAKPSQPKEAQVMGAILKEMGIVDYEPGVINQMLEFTYRYVTSILEDSRVYANYAKKGKSIELEDVRLAIHMQVEKAFTTPPPRDLLLEVARTRNSNPLPPIKPQCGIRLPPDRYCLSQCNMRLKSSVKKGGRMGSNSWSKGGGNPLKPNISMVTNKTGNTQTVTLVQKPTNAAAATPPQKVVGVSRPIIKVTPGPPGGVTPKIQIPSGLKSATTIKTEDGTLPNQSKRKREDDDYDT